MSSEPIKDPSSIISLLKPPSEGEKGKASNVFTLLRSTSADNGGGISKESIIDPPESLKKRYLFESLPEHLDPKQSEITVIISSASGTGKASSYFKEVLSPALAFHGLCEHEGYRVFETTSVGSIREFVETNVLLQEGERTQRRRQTIILLSGDTGIFDILNALSPARHRHPSSKPILALFPLGTGNALSSSLHKTSSALSSLFLGTPHPLPFFRAKFSPGAQLLTNEGKTRLPLPYENGERVLYGSVVLSWGFHATLVADSDSPDLRVYGVKRFSIAAREGLQELHRYRGSVEFLLDAAEGGGIKRRRKRLEREEHFYTLATLVSNLEEKLCISPLSKPGGRGLRVIHFPPLSAENVMGIMQEAYMDGAHVDEDGKGKGEVGYELVEGIRICVDEEEGRWRRVCVDGVIVELEAGGWAEAGVVEEGDEMVEVVWRE